MNDLLGTVHLSQKGSEIGSFCYQPTPRDHGSAGRDHRFFPAEDWTAICNGCATQTSAKVSIPNLWTGGWDGVIEFHALIL